jgi:hypothetical protein
VVVVVLADVVDGAVEVEVEVEVEVVAEVVVTSAPPTQATTRSARIANLPRCLPE